MDYWKQIKNKRGDKMNHKISRTLLEDLEKIYHSIKCEEKDGSYCMYCNYCKNKSICDITLTLVCSIRKFYFEVEK